MSLALKGAGHYRTITRSISPVIAHALTYGRWAIQPLVRAWHQVVEQEGRWRAHRYEGFCPVACDLVGFFRPHLRGCVGKHYQSGADKALPAIVLVVISM